MWGYLWCLSMRVIKIQVLRMSPVIFPAEKESYPSYTPQNSVQGQGWGVEYIPAVMGKKCCPLWTGHQCITGTNNKQPSLENVWRNENLFASSKQGISNRADWQFIRIYISGCSKLLLWLTFICFLCIFLFENINCTLIVISSYF